MARPIFLLSGTVPVLMLLLTGVYLAGCNNAPTEKEIPPPTQSTGHSHETAEETCFICDAAKRDPGRLWCNGHGRYEDRCFMCHPEIEDPDRLFCAGHGLYEDECFLCHPEILQQPPENEENQGAGCLHENNSPLASDALSEIPVPLFCNEHTVQEDECGICHPDLIKSLPLGEGLKIRFSSPNSTKKAGVRTGFPNERSVSTGVQALGELTYNKNKLAVVTPYAQGVIESIFVDVGQSVEEGQLMAELGSPAISDAKNAFVVSLLNVELHQQTYEREKGLIEEKISSQQDYQDARVAYAASRSEVERTRQQLFNVGLTTEEVLAVEKDRSTSSVLPLRAPFAGVIVERNAVLGMAVDTGDPLFSVADLSTMWLELSVPEGPAVHLQTGAAVRAQFDAFSGEKFYGEVTWIASHIDRSTRTVQVRTSIPNPGFRLKSGLFGRALIIETTEAAAFDVPEAAVQYIDETPVVFAKLADDLYETRSVRTGPTSNGFTTILAGLTQLDEIVVSESFVLKSELLKGRLGAGCVDE